MKSITSQKQFNDLTRQELPFILDFYADWCGPCQTLLPTVEKLAEEYNGKVHILKVNVDDQRGLAEHFNVKSIPSLFFMKKNEIHGSLKGLASERELRKQIETLSKSAS